MQTTTYEVVNGSYLETNIKHEKKTKVKLQNKAMFVELVFTNGINHYVFVAIHY